MPQRDQYLIKQFIQSALALAGLSLHRRASVERVLRENERLHAAAGLNAHAPPPDAKALSPSDPKAEREWLLAELKKHEGQKIFYSTAEDYGSFEKTTRIVDRLEDFGNADFAELSCWLFASSLSNHRVIHQRIDEGSLLWRAVKMSGGPILEVGRAAGGSTLVLLGASGSRRLSASIANPPMPPSPSTFSNGRMYHVG